MRLNGKIGIVTAAGSGMGRAGVLRFSAEGAAVVVVDIDSKRVAEVTSEITNAGGRAIGIAGDLRQDEFARGIVHRAIDAFGGLDFVWNHVGHPGPAAIEGIDMADFETAVDLNLRTCLVTTEAAIPMLRARGGGSLLFTASTAGLRGSFRSPVYSAVKFGVVGLVRGLAIRYGPENIRVNALCPGIVDTPMLRVFMNRPDSKKPANQDVETLITQASKGAPLGRSAKPEEIASAALFLVSDEASFISGVELPIDGGLIA